MTALGGPDCSHGNTASVICSGKGEGQVEMGYWYSGCSWSEMSPRVESEVKEASESEICFVVKYGSSHCSFIFQVRARSVKGNNIFLSNIVAYM